MSYPQWTMRERPTRTRSGNIRLHARRVRSAMHDVVAGHGALPAPAVRLLAAGLAEALRDIHTAGVIHRDLKPSNVLLAVDGPRVIDFGIARAADATTITRTGIAVGSPRFMSPEQVDGQPVTPATDVFALGAVLVFAGTGRAPFGDGAASAVLYRIVHGAVDQERTAADREGPPARCQDSGRQHRQANGEPPGEDPGGTRLNTPTAA